MVVTLKEERNLKVFENSVLRRVFGPKRDEKTGVEKTNYRIALSSVLTKYHSGDKERDERGM